MAQPYDYTINVPNPMQGFMQGVQTMTQLQALGEARRDAEAKRMRQEALQSRIADFIVRPSAKGVSMLMLEFPEYSEPFSRVLEPMQAEEKKVLIQQANDVFMPLVSGRKDLAVENLRSQVTAAENSDDTGRAKTLRTLLKMLESDETGQLGDDSVIMGSASLLSQAMGPEQFEKTYGTVLEQYRKSKIAPFERKEAESKSKEASTKAKFAESSALLDLEKKGWDIKKVQSDIDISKQNAKIAMMNAAIARESNDLKRQELALKVDDAIRQRDEKINAKASEGSEALSKVDNMLSNIDRALATPVNTIYRAAGPLASKVPTAMSDTADFEELINTIGSQAFMSQVSAMRGLGALTENEGKKLTASLANFSLRQSPQSLIKNLEIAKNLVSKMRANIQKKYGAPDGATAEQPATGSGVVEVDF